MIAKSAITHWRGTAPWGADWQVEQDLVISRALVAIFADPFLREQLAFRGGTALHKLYFKPPERYSEDIDLVRTENGPVGPILDRLRPALEPWLGRGGYDATDRSAKLLFHFDSEGPPAVPLRLKVEINVRETFSIDGLRSLPFEVDSPWFQGSSDITTFSLEELLATKLRALFQRSKGRDAFDLHLGLEHPDYPSPERIVEMFLGYMERQEHAISRAAFEESIEGKANDPDFLGDIHPLLAAEAPRYDSLRGLRSVERDLVALVPGDPWAGREG